MVEVLLTSGFTILFVYIIYKMNFFRLEGFSRKTIASLYLIKLCAGIGLALKMLQVDYAYIHPLKTSPFEFSHVVSVGMLLNKFNRIKGKITS